MDFARNCRIFVFIAIACQLNVHCELLDYPKVLRDENSVDDYFGIKVPDPYRWLERLPTPDVFIKDQNDLTTSYVTKCPNRTAIRDQLGAIWNNEKSHCPRRGGSRYFTTKSSGLQHHDVLYVQESLKGSLRVLVDPNTMNLTLEAGGDIKFFSPSKNGEIVAYGLSTADHADNVQVHFINVTSGQHFPDVLELNHTEIIWSPADEGIIYGAYTSESHGVLYFHRLGTNQENDQPVVSMENPNWTIGYGFRVTTDEKHLILAPTESDGPGYNYLLYVDLDPIVKSGYKIQGKVKPIVTERMGKYTYLASDGDLLYFLTNHNAPHHKIISIDINNSNESDWKTVIPERADVLDWAVAVNKNMVALSYLKDVSNTLELHNMTDGTLIKTFPLPPGNIGEHCGLVDDQEFFIQFSSVIALGQTYRVDLSKSESEWKLEKYLELEPKGFDSDNYSVKQVFYPGKDGVKIPMTVAHKKSVIYDGQSPLLLYGYGAFGIPVTSIPQAFVAQAFFMQHFDGIVAIASVRGGGEYGKDWHDSGKLFKKQNSFDDFIAAAEYLQRNNYTNPKKTVINGGSNGGLLVGACINQRPELFGAAVGQIGLYDVIRFGESHLCFEYGCTDTKESVEYVLTYSPVQNVKMPTNGTQYPAVLLVTGDMDDRVSPWHSYKFASELQHTVGRNPSQTNPVLLRIESNMGAKNLTSQAAIEEWVDIFSFLVQTIGIAYKQ